MPQALGGVVWARKDSRVAGGSKLGAGGVGKRAPRTQPLSVGGRFSGRVPQRPMGVLRCALESWAQGAAASFPCALPLRPGSILPESPLLVRWYGPGLKGPGGLGPAQCVGDGGCSLHCVRGEAEWPREWGCCRARGHVHVARSGHAESATLEGQVGGCHPYNLCASSLMDVRDSDSLGGPDGFRDQALSLHLEAH